MNTYRYSFSAACPSDGDIIRYHLAIETHSVIMAEALVASCEFSGLAYHEDIADRLHAALSGLQRLVATHRGVTIETLRGSI